MPKSTNGRVHAGRHLAVARQVHGARHRLADRVEADAGGVGALRAEGRVGGEDDARIDGRDGVVVDAHRLAGLRRAGWRSPRRTTATSFLTISRPAGFMGLSVRPSLLRPIWRNIAPSPPSATGVTQRSSLPSSFSMRITSAPRSPSIVPQNGPAMYRPKSRTRIPSRTPAMNVLPPLDSPIQRPWNRTAPRTRIHPGLVQCGGADLQPGPAAAFSSDGPLTLNVFQASSRTCWRLISPSLCFFAASVHTPLSLKARTVPSW